MTTFLRLALLAAMSALGACGGSSPGGQPSGPTTLAKSGGDQQTGIVGAALTTPLRVKVTYAGGTGVSGVAVAWAAVSGGGKVWTGSSATDANGEAWAIATLGAAAGTNTFTATAASPAGSPVGLSVIARVQQGLAPAFAAAHPAVVGVVAVSTGTKRFDVDLSIDAAGDTVVVLPNSVGYTSGIFEAPGAGLSLTGSGSSYHTYQLVYHPSTRTADLYVDGALRLQGYPGLTTYSADEGGSPPRPGVPGPRWPRRSRSNGWSLTRR